MLFKIRTRRELDSVYQYCHDRSHFLFIANVLVGLRTTDYFICSNDALWDPDQMDLVIRGHGGRLVDWRRLDYSGYLWRDIRNIITTAVTSGIALSRYPEIAEELSDGEDREELEWRRATRVEEGTHPSNPILVEDSDNEEMDEDFEGWSDYIVPESPFNN